MGRVGFKGLGVREASKRFFFERKNHSAPASGRALFLQRRAFAEAARAAFFVAAP